jgi:hypothetical protein
MIFGAPEPVSTCCDETLLADTAMPALSRASRAHMAGSVDRSMIFKQSWALFFLIMMRVRVHYHGLTPPVVPVSWPCGYDGLIPVVVLRALGQVPGDYNLLFLDQ